MSFQKKEPVRPRGSWSRVVQTSPHSIAVSPQTVKLGNWSIRLPRRRLTRISIGILLTVFGLFGFLPILGHWMLVLGLLVLSVDIAFVRRWRRQAEVALGRWIIGRYPRRAARIGFTAVNGRA